MVSFIKNVFTASKSVNTLTDTNGLDANNLLDNSSTSTPFDLSQTSDTQPSQTVLTGFVQASNIADANTVEDPNAVIAPNYVDDSGMFPHDPTATPDVEKPAIDDLAIETVTIDDSGMFRHDTTPIALDVVIETVTPVLEKSTIEHEIITGVIDDTGMIDVQSQISSTLRMIFDAYYDDHAHTVQPIDISHVSHDTFMF